MRLDFALNPKTLHPSTAACAVECALDTGCESFAWSSIAKTCYLSLDRAAFPDTDLLPPAVAEEACADEALRVYALPRTPFVTKDKDMVIVLQVNPRP